MNLHLSVIVPTRRRVELLRKCLDSLVAQTLSRSHFEVLVVDGDSEGSASSVAAAYTHRLPLICIRTNGHGLHVGRHIGVRHAESDLLVIIDDDIQAERAWLESILCTFQDPTVALVGGNNRPLFEDPPPNWLRRWWDQPTYRGRALGHLSILDFGEGYFDIDPTFVWGCNFSIRRDVLQKAGGFHPDAFPPELLRYRGDGETHVSEFVRRSGLRAVFNSAASVQHFVSKERMTKKYFEQRAFAQGISDSYSAIRRNGGVDDRLSMKARALIRRFRLTAGHVIRSAHAVSDKVERELLSVRRAAAKAYWQGYDFHRRETQSDPALLEWVLRDNYL